MPTKLRSGKVIDPSMDELSGLFSKSMKFTTPISKKMHASKDNMLTKMFSRFTIGKKIGKTRKRGTPFTHTKRRKTAKPSGMDLTGGRRPKRRHSKQSKSKRKY